MNIYERREYLHTLLEQGIAYSPALARELAQRFSCSPSAIYADYTVYIGKPYWREKKRLDHNSVYHANMKAEKLGLNERITVDQWVEICNAYGNMCLRCRKIKQLSLDHVIPFAMGGHNTIGNIQPLCKSCNSKKGQLHIDYRKPPPMPITFRQLLAF